VRVGTLAYRGASAVAATIGRAALLVCAPTALASVNQMIDFQSPAITASEFVVITSQYSGEGLAFISPSEGPVEQPKGSGDEPFAQADLERESGTQLITAYEHEGIDGPGECVKAWSDLAGRLTQEEHEGSEKISVDVGAGSSIFGKSGGGKINTGLAGSQGATAKLPISVFRESGANNEIQLHVSRLPHGVTVSGGSTIASGNSSTTMDATAAEPGC
jgi:hypothetical protein